MASLVESPERTRLERLRGPALTAGLVGAATLALRLRDPHESGSWGYCPFHALTGLWCPACGGLRAVNDLTHGDLLGAASSNLVFVVSLPLLVLWFWRWTRREWTGPLRDAGAVRQGGAALVHANALLVGLAAVLVVFAVLRNLPAFGWLAP